MGLLHGFTFKKGLKEMFSQIRRSAERVPRVRKRKSGLGPFSYHLALNYNIESSLKNSIRGATLTIKSIIYVKSCKLSLSISFYHFKRILFQVINNILFFFSKN